MSLQCGMRHILLLIWSLVSLMLGLLSLRSAPSMFFLKLKVVVTEYGYLGSILQGIGLLSTRKLRSRVGRRFNALTTASILAGSLCTTLPLLRAMFYAVDLNERFDTAFGDSASEQHSRPVISLPRLFMVWPASLRRAERRVFSKTDDYELTLDLFRPPNPSQKGDPCIVVVHGGSWTHGSSREFGSLSPHLAAQGYVVVGINYRKADKHPFPAARNDLRSAIDYVKDNAADLGVDKDRIALLGRSAGGQLALLVAYDQEDPDIRGVVSFYAPTDMVYGFNDPTDPRVIDTPETLSLYLRGTPHNAREVYDAASPISFVRQDSPRTLLLHGSHDEMVHIAQSDRLANQLQTHLAPHLYIRLPWATHGFDHNLWGPGGQISTYTVERFLYYVLRKQP